MLSVYLLDTLCNCWMFFYFRENNREKVWVLVMQHCYLTPANAAASVCTTGVKGNESRLSEHTPITEVMKSRCAQLISHCAPGGCVIVCITVTLETSSLLFYITASPQYNSSKKECWKMSLVMVNVC